MSKTIVYIDGFNLYYALKKNNSKWLDIEKLCNVMLTKNEIIAIKYFTARVSSRLGDLDVHVRQNTYLRALRSNPKIEIIYGHFLTNDKWMVQTKDSGKDPKQIKKVQVIVTEEKGSDVNIATHLLADGFQNKYDTAAVITNDSDLKLPISTVKTLLKKSIGVICPHEHPSRELKNAATFLKTIRPDTFNNCQLQDSFKDKNGTITKPVGW